MHDVVLPDERGQADDLSASETPRANHSQGIVGTIL